MAEQRYGIEVAELIFKNCCGDYVDFTKEGVFVKQEYVHAWLEPTEAFAWTAACEMDWADAPDPLTYPALPVDFSSQELAAFLLDGVGFGMVATEYGDFSDGPYKDKLEQLGIRGVKAKRVLQDAYANLRAAMNKVGHPDTARKHWRKAMVTELLKPATDTATKPHAAPAEQVKPEFATERDYRWLEVWDKESPSHERGSQVRAIAHIVRTEGVNADTVKKGLQRAKTARQDAHREGVVRLLPGQQKAPKKAPATYCSGLTRKG